MIAVRPMARPFRAMGLLRGTGGPNLVYILLFFILANVVLLPLALVVMTAFNFGPMRTTEAGATFKYFVDQWQSQSLGETLSTTLVFAIGSSVIALCIGV